MATKKRKASKSTKKTPLLLRLRNIFHKNPLIAFLELVIVVVILILAVRQSGAANYCSVDATTQNAVTSAPLMDLGSNVYTRLTSLGPPPVYSQTNPQFTGGLYSNGSNVPPSAHLSAGQTIAGQIQPLNSSGNADPNGKIGFVAVGMSNTKKEFEKFIRTRTMITNFNNRVILVNGAQTNVSAEYWRDPSNIAWTNLLSLVSSKNLTSNQVQVAWVKLAESGSGDFPAKAQALQSDLTAVVRNLKTYFPNIKIAFLSSRTHSYKYFDGLSPEPTAFETGFAVKWLIEDQIAGNPDLKYSSSGGAAVAPILFWGPYLWADTQPRSDGFTWTPQDLISDCTHPSDAGSEKVASLLRSFFSTNSLATPWFLTGITAPTPTSGGGPTPTSGGTTPSPTRAPRQTPTP